MIDQRKFVGRDWGTTKLGAEEGARRDALHRMMAAGYHRNSDVTVKVRKSSRGYEGTATVIGGKNK